MTDLRMAPRGIALLKWPGFTRFDVLREPSISMWFALYVSSVSQVTLYVSPDVDLV
jgi:hypothetical protein